MGSSGSSAPYTIRHDIRAPHYEAAQDTLAEIKAILDDSQRGGLIPKAGRQQLLDDHFNLVEESHRLYEDRRTLSGAWMFSSRTRRLARKAKALKEGVEFSCSVAEMRVSALAAARFRKRTVSSPKPSKANLPSSLQNEYKPPLQSSSKSSFFKRWSFRTSASPGSSQENINARSNKKTKHHSSSDLPKPHLSQHNRSQTEAAIPTRSEHRTTLQKTPSSSRDNEVASSSRPQSKEKSSRHHSREKTSRQYSQDSSNKYHSQDAVDKHRNRDTDRPRARRTKRASADAYGQRDRDDRHDRERSHRRTHSAESRTRYPSQTSYAISNDGHSSTGHHSVPLQHTHQQYNQTPGYNGVPIPQQGTPRHPHAQQYTYTPTTYAPRPPPVQQPVTYYQNTSANYAAPPQMYVPKAPPPMLVQVSSPYQLGAVVPRTEEYDPTKLRRKHRRR